MISQFIDCYDHDIPLTWFDRELKSVTGIDIYDDVFPYDKGYLRVEKGNIDLLVMRVELSDNTKREMIENLINIPHFALTNSNVSSQKKYSLSYREFCKEIRLPESYLERLLTSKYARHFYSDSELEGFWKRWRCS
ncbi:MAG: hypothetical protein D3904_15205 [Candidatus Electrothrix sp. EH2]|nr:hypothetical protein [Candidatus Electrothrix sp. EH2]